MQAAENGPGELLRADKWLWYARFFKTRSRATAFCAGGRLRINRRLVERPSVTVRVGDVLTFPHGSDVRVVRVVRLGVRRGPPAEARSLYEDLVDRTAPER